MLDWCYAKESLIKGYKRHTECGVDKDLSILPWHTVPADLVQGTKLDGILAYVRCT